MTIKNVTIGDTFKNRKTKSIATVVDFVENKSLATGAILGHTCIALEKVLGQTVTFEVPFSTVIRNKTSN